MLEILQDIADVAGHAAEVAPFHRGINVDHRLIVVVRNQRRLCVQIQLRQIAQQFLRPIGRSGGNRNIVQRLHGVDLVLRHLHGHVVFSAGGRVDPERGVDLKARAQREQQAIGHVLFAQPHRLCPGAVDIQEQRRVGEQAAEREHPRLQGCAATRLDICLRQLIVDALIGADQLNIDREPARRNSESG